MTHGAPGGIGRVEQLLAAVWSRDARLQVTTLQRMPRPSYLTPAPAGPVARMGTVRWLLTILTTLVASRPDVVIFNHINFAPLALLVGRRRPATRLIVWAYGMEAWQRPARLRRLGMQRADQVWAISEYTAATVTAQSRLDPGRIAVVPLALLPERSRALGQSPAPVAPAEVLTVSRLWPGEAKGIDHQIEALVDTDPAVRLVVVGDGDDRPRLERLAAATGVRSRVSFMGQTDDPSLLDLYRRCRVVALPSNREGFGLVFLEAMAAAKPVIAARAGAAPELVRDGETGVLVPYGDRQALAHAMTSLIRDGDRATQLGQRGRQVAEQRFGFDRFAGQVTTLLGAGC